MGAPVVSILKCINKSYCNRIARIYVGSEQGPLIRDQSLDAVIGPTDARGKCQTPGI